MIWGGLKPIRRRFIIDVGTLTALTYAALILPPSTIAHKATLALSCAVTFFTAGLTTRWTISFPMVPIVLLQCSRYSVALVSDGSWTSLAIKMFSLLLVSKSFLLTILFPAVKINKVKGKWNVGIIDLHLPVENFFEHEHVTVRLLYPTLEKSVRVPYFDVENGPRICKALMKVGAPPPLNKLNFMLNHWRLSTVDGKRNATPHVPAASNDDNVKDGDGTSGKEASRPKLPIAIYSHGLTGSAELYSYQTMSLAANGTFVISITHSDSSAIDVTRKDGSFISYDPKISQLAGMKETFEDSVKQRRRQVDYRARELLAAADALAKLNERNADELKELGVSFVDKLDLKDIVVLGHSFGGATAINAAHMRPNMFMCCIAHDPAIDWCTDGKIQYRCFC
jgi:hypothetical protein